jgi:Molecular chaperone (small heat shock protein)
MYPSLTRYSGDLFAELERQLDQALGLRSWPSSIRAAHRGAFPALNVGRTQDAVEIYAFAPGIDPAKLEVSVDKGVLTISGERAADLPESSEKVNVYADERFDGAFRRVLSLPEDVDAGPRGREIPRRHPAHLGAQARKIQAAPHRRGRGVRREPWT